ncbi:MAG TPA: hypothetical protein VF832_09715 [Longimicrobiales bacterium]
MGARDRDRVPEESVEPILARAAELDRHKRETVSVDVLRSAALEAGISPDAVDRAVQEYSAGVTASGPEQQEPLVPRPAQPLTGRKAIGVMAIGALAASGAAVVAHAHTPGLAFGVMGIGGLLVALTVRFSWRRPPSK